MRSGPSVKAWRPDVPGITEVLHADFPAHVYPSHTHETWTLLLVDAGVVRFGLGGRQQIAGDQVVTLLPPHVAHDGRPATGAGFVKRVVYLDQDRIDVRHVGGAVDHPGWADPTMRRQVDRLHHALLHPGDAFEAESRLALICDRVSRHLGALDPQVAEPSDPRLAWRLRELLDGHVAIGMTLAEAAARLHAHETHLVRAFTREFGIAPHRYLTGRRLDRARRMLLAGDQPADIAARVGFYDQAHLTRHFRRLLGVTPAAFAAS